MFQAADTGLEHSFTSYIFIFSIISSLFRFIDKHVFRFIRHSIPVPFDFYFKEICFNSHLHRALL